VLTRASILCEEISSLKCREHKSLFYRSSADWYLGYPDAALAEADKALTEARAIGHAATLMVAMGVTSLTRLLRGDYLPASKILNELDVLAEQKGSAQWKAFGVSIQGCQAALTGEASHAVQTINSGVEAWQSTGSTTLYGPIWSLHLAIAYARLDQFDNAWRCISEAMAAIETTKERWWEAEINRVAGGISLRSPQADIAAAESYFDRALAVARAQQAKSWELRAATSLARLWHEHDKPRQALGVLTPVYDWFTEGFDTRDLKDAEALLESLA
jgi:predicted ATPase